MKKTWRRGLCREIRVERIAPPPGANRSTDWSESLHARGVPLVNLGLLCRAKAEDVFVRFSAQNPSIVAADWGSGRRMFWKKRDLVRDVHCWKVAKSSVASLRPAFSFPRYRPSHEPFASLFSSPDSHPFCPRGGSRPCSDRMLRLLEFRCVCGSQELDRHGLRHR
jgi:hypothetical protein